ncbi:MBL fold metallo-hydrolase [Nonomuraea sp. FMUSA5-5]|uniref:MBL fold metallo-hydrolase n=1 Tax=Nonomuraea composti TaxID=2720023 RepID=A0ABX1B8Q6_9ACTN|nr:MBL fold metallo-hydrolase [Nonomuraea sp. FMUSA5-5]NJP93911.1 MBL fold metallo-hydrolase [Nonomuraea sp. FMUSA5-5]
MSTTATTSAQAPGFARTRVGAVTVTTVYDGALPIYAADMHGEPAERIAALLADGFLPPEGDPATAVNAFLFRSGGRLVLVDAGAGASLGPGTGQLPDNLRAAGAGPEQVDDVLITHLHQDHAYGLVTADGEAAFPSATVHVAALEARHWLDDVSGYLLDGGGEQLLMWGDTMHNHTVQLRAPHVAMEIGSDRAGARAARQRVLEEIRTRGRTVGGAHLPFPGIGRIAFRDGEARWVPVPYRPVPWPGQARPARDEG